MGSDRYVLLDRDGTLIVEKNYLADPAGVELLPGVGEGLQHLRAAGWKLVVVTNQSGVGRGWFTLADVQRVHDRLVELLAPYGVTFAGIYLCPHTPDEQCNCRKPRVGMIEQATRELVFDPRYAVMIGDKALDIELGRAVGAQTILVTTGYGAEVHARGDVRADFVCGDLRQAAVWIIERSTADGQSAAIVS